MEANESRASSSSSSCVLTDEHVSVFNEHLGGADPHDKEVQRKVFSVFKGAEHRNVRCLFRRYLSIRRGVPTQNGILTEAELGEQPLGATESQKESVTA